MPSLTRRGFLAGGTTLAFSPTVSANARSAGEDRRDPRLLVIGADALPPGWLASLAETADPALPWPHRLLGVGTTMPASLGAGAALCCRQSPRLLPPARLATLLAPSTGRRPARVAAARMPGALRDRESDEALATALGRLLAEPAGPRVVALSAGRGWTGSGPAQALHGTDRRSSLLAAFEAGLGACRRETLVVSCGGALEGLALAGGALRAGDEKDGVGALARHLGLPREGLLAALAASTAQG